MQSSNDVYRNTREYTCTRQRDESIQTLQIGNFEKQIRIFTKSAPSRTAFTVKRGGGDKFKLVQAQTRELRSAHRGKPAGELERGNGV